MIFEDFFFYNTHRLFHHPYLYKKFHKIHHENYSTISIHCVYAHWFEFIFGNLLGVYSGFLIFRN